MIDHRDDDEAIGYGRPPKQTRFKPGHSGNPKGRPKKSRNRLKILAEELSQTVVITENGARKKVSKAEVILRQLVNKSAAGDLRALSGLLPQWASLDEKEGDTGTARPALSEAENAVLKNIASRMGQATGGDDEAN